MVLKISEHNIYTIFYSDTKLPMKGECILKVRISK